MSCCVLLVATSAVWTTTHPAERSAPGDAGVVITIEGHLQRGDEKRFLDELTTAMVRTPLPIVVELRSPEGSETVALAIADLIQAALRARVPVRTFVPNGHRCTRACGIIFAVDHGSTGSGTARAD